MVVRICVIMINISSPAVICIFNFSFISWLVTRCAFSMVMTTVIMAAVVITFVNTIVIMRRSCFAIFDRALVFIVFASDWLLTFIDESTVSMPVPSAFVTLVLVLIVRSIPISGTFEFASSFMARTRAVIVTVFSREIFTGYQFFAIAGSLGCPLTSG